MQQVQLFLVVVLFAFVFLQGKTLAPQDPDWIFKRAAAILRHLYLRPNCGVGAFRKVFSCKNGKKCIPGHTSKVCHVWKAVVAVHGAGGM